MDDERLVGNGQATPREMGQRVGALEKLVDVTNAFQKALDAERDRRYEDRFKAQETAVVAALSAIEKQTTSTFAASREAILKAEESQKAVNATNNEFRGQLADQAARLMTRTETEVGLKAARAEADSGLSSVRELLSRMETELRSRVEGLRGDLTSLRESRSEITGHDRGSVEDKARAQWVVATIIAILALLSGVGSLLYVVMHK